MQNLTFDISTTCNLTAPRSIRQASRFVACGQKRARLSDSKGFDPSRWGCRCEIAKVVNP